MASQGNRSALTLLAAGILGAFAASACGSSPALAPGPDAGAGAGGAMGNAIRYVFVIAMENADAETVYDSADWSYLDSVLLPQAARAEAFQDELPIGLPSEPHYVWMEAGKNVFADHTFTTDDAPSASNSTADPNHLVAQLAQAEHGADWMSYQEGLDAVTGACPLAGSGFYRPNHDPFVFFRDVAGTPPSTGAATCVAHHRPLSALTADLAAGSVSAYIFITPNLCHNGHGQSDCPDANAQQSADQWLSEALPPLIAFAGAHDGAIFLVWDEGNSGRVLPFVAIGPHVKAGYASSVTYSHGSLLKSLEEIFALPILPAVTTASDFADLFQPGSFP